jgi:hypothetical protein
MEMRSGKRAPAGVESNEFFVEALESDSIFWTGWTSSGSAR